MLIMDLVRSVYKMKIWEDRARELIKEELLEFTILDMLQREMEEAGIFAGDKLVKTRINMAQQIINNVKGKNEN